MRIGSLFSGIGGLELGLERAGVGRTVWQVEKDPYCRRVLARHWPHAIRYEDVTTVDWSAVEPVEVLCGGFPCQDISIAGRDAGLDGERSGLWREYVRALRHLRPRFGVVENVTALLARGMGVVLGDLAACGYDAEWDCIPAAAVGAPHNRDRVYVVAWRVPDPDRQRLRDRTERGEGSARSADGRYAQSLHMGPWVPRSDDVRALRAMPDGTQPAVCRASHGLPGWVDRRRALGNAVVPQVAEVVGHRLVGNND